MGLMEVGSDFVKIVVMTILIYFTYIKSMNYNENNFSKIVLVITSSIIIAIVYIIIGNEKPPLCTIALLYMVYAIFIKNITKCEKIKFNVLAYIISCAASYIIYLVSVILSGLVIFIFFKSKEYMNALNLIIIPFFAEILFLIFAKMKRVKHGVNFLKNNSNNNINLIGLLLIGLIFVIFAFLQRKNSLLFGSYLITGFIIIMFSFFVWIKSQITKTYKSKMRDRTIEIQKTEIDEKNKILEEVKEENLKFAKTIHKYNKKLSALEFEIKSKLEQETNTEFASELAIILKETKETAENFAKETEIKSNKLPETNIPGIDTMLKYMQEEARAKNINLDVKLNASINSLLENIISKDKFETLIGDHLKDAIIAVEASKNSHKSILVTIGLVEGIYEFSVYDTGIEFEIETLLKLGEEQVTTHKETGGSGIGFMTTFETLKECRASLVIEEYNPETTSYTKCITIRFDGKNKYKIYSYRANKLKEQKHKRKITIEELR